jgi:hypothetical protein
LFYSPSFIICTDDSLKSEKAKIKKAFSTMLTFIPKEDRHRFELRLWDDDGLLAAEKELGLVTIL